jgi:hypothetical protein
MGPDSPQAFPEPLPGQWRRSRVGKALGGLYTAKNASRVGSCWTVPHRVAGCAGAGENQRRSFASDIRHERPEYTSSLPHKHCSIPMLMPNMHRQVCLGS